MLDADDLRDVDERLLDYLREGRVTPAYARERLMSDDVDEYSRGYVQQRLSRLEEHGHASNCGGGLYELVEDPRADGEQTSTTEPERELEEFQERIESALEWIDATLDAIEDVDGERAAENAEAARAALVGSDDG